MAATASKGSRAKSSKAFDATAWARSRAGEGRRPRMTDAHRAEIIAGLDRARKSIEAEMSDKSVKPAPGTYALDLAIAVAGDVVVAEPRTAASRVVPIFGEQSLLIAVLAGMQPSERERAIRDAVVYCHRGTTDAAVQATCAECKQLLDATSTDEQTKRGLTETKGGGPVAGATTGKPGVVVVGTVGARAVQIDIKGE